MPRISLETSLVVFLASTILLYVSAPQFLEPTRWSLAAMVVIIVVVVASLVILLIRIHGRR